MQDVGAAMKCYPMGREVLDELRQQLAAANERIAKLQKVVEQAKIVMEHRNGRGFGSYSKAFDAMEKALAELDAP
jgi:AmiR/NasT family two-component response regulator